MTWLGNSWVERQGRGKCLEEQMLGRALLLGSWCGLGEENPHPDPPSKPCVIRCLIHPDTVCLDI